MKRIFFDENTIVAFHIGRGGRFNNDGHITFLGQHTIDEFVHDLFISDDEGFYKTESGHNTGLTKEAAESGIGRIDIDGGYDTTYTMRVGDIDGYSDEWNAVFRESSFDAEQVQMVLEPFRAINTLEELACYLNTDTAVWEDALEVINKNGWEDLTNHRNDICSDGFDKIVLDSNDNAVVVKEEE